jgi:hypothetical protein
MSANGQALEKTPLEIALEMVVTPESREPVLKMLHGLISTVMVEELSSPEEKTDVQQAAEARVYAELLKELQKHLPKAYRGTEPLRKETRYTTPGHIPKS